MEAAITFRVPPELTLDEDQKGQLSGLVQTKLEETKTLTLVSTDEQFETTGERLKIIAYIRERIKGTLKPYIEFWHKGHKAHTELLATLDGPLEARERSMKQGLARHQRERGSPAPGRRTTATRRRGATAQTGRGRTEAEGTGGCGGKAQDGGGSSCRSRQPGSCRRSGSSRAHS